MHIVEVCSDFMNTHIRCLPSTLDQSAADQFFDQPSSITVILTNLSITLFLRQSFTKRENLLIQVCGIFWFTFFKHKIVIAHFDFLIFSVTC